MTSERQKIALNLYELYKTFFHFTPVIICWSLFCCTLLFVYKDIVKKPVFTAESSIYVLSRTADSDYGRLDISDLDVSRQMKMDSLSILGSEQIAEEVIVNLVKRDIPLETMSASSLLNMVSIYSADDSLEITIAATGSDPYIVCEIANAYRETAIKELNTRIMARGIQTVKEAIIPTKHSGRPSTFYAIAGFLLGLISSFILITIIYVVQYAKRETEDVEGI